MTQKLRKAKAPFYFDLPTEQEWEYACRAGTSTPFFWGDTWSPDKANCNGRSPYGPTAPLWDDDGFTLERPTPVGSYPPNAWGIYDMHGNISEWVADWYPGYEDCPELFADWRYPDSTEESLAREFPREGTCAAAAPCFFSLSHFCPYFPPLPASERKTTRPTPWQGQIKVILLP